MKKKIDKPYVSIITPNLNCEKFIENTIQSVINQNSQNYEYILIDGKSTDKSIKIIKKYIDKIDTFISEKDKGMYYAIDKGIRKAKGNVIIWINSDDILDENAVRNVENFFKKNPDIDWISGINGYIKNNFKFSGIPYVYPRFILKKGYAQHPLWGFVQQESISFRKNLYTKVGGFEYNYSYACDYGLWIKFSKVTSLKTVFFKIGFFRYWAGQDSKLNKVNIFKSIGYKKIPFYSFRYIRNFLSLLMLPYVVIKTYFLTK